MSIYHGRRSIHVIMMLIISAHSGSIYGADEIGRLFTTPDQRQALDKLRNRDLPETDQTTGMSGSDTGTRALDNRNVAVRGFVYRKKGKGTVWIHSAQRRIQEVREWIWPAMDTNTVADVLKDFPSGPEAIKVAPEGN